jgi:putative aldouronate transport system permease protein
MTAFPLSITKLKGRKALMYYFVFTMLFNGGLIPSFLLMRNLNLLNKLWALILPHIVNVFNLIILKNYFEGLPESTYEAAKIDGASNIRVLFQIIIPMSKPILATLAVFFAVGFWNSYFNAMLYITKPEKVTLQLFLVNIVRQAENPLNIGDEALNVPADSVRASTAMIATLPILMVYPFMQRHFVKGITIGSVKG